jgi:Flp pilus assembly protein TadB
MQYDRERQSGLRRTTAMLWTITIILVVLWLVGFIGFHVVGAWIHILLVLALIVLVFQLLSGRRAI